jgi:2-amino-4-hydroxy-6-hydroxymethyldihydropteridine diphosphokinase
VKNFNKIILSIGSNVGNRQQNIENSLKELSRVSQIKKVSSMYDSEAILFEEQENFFNLVVEVEYKKNPQHLLKDIKKIEKLIGRKETFRYGPRVIDIDIIFFNNIDVQDKELTIPHYDWKNRRFVIEPLSELFNDFKLLDYKINDQKLVKVGTINYK